MLFVLDHGYGGAWVFKREEITSINIEIQSISQMEEHENQTNERLLKPTKYARMQFRLEFLK